MTKCVSNEKVRSACEINLILQSFPMDNSMWCLQNVWLCNTGATQWLDGTTPSVTDLCHWHFWTGAFQMTPGCFWCQNCLFVKVLWVMWYVCWQYNILYGIPALIIKKLVSKYLKLVVQWCTEHTSKTYLMKVCVPKAAGCIQELSN